MGRLPKGDVLFTPDQREARRRQACAKARAYIARVTRYDGRGSLRDDLRKELLDEGFAISIFAVYRIANPASRVAINDRTLDRFLRGIRAIEKRRKIRL